MDMDSHLFFLEHPSILSNNIRALYKDELWQILRDSWDMTVKIHQIVVATTCI